MVGVHPSSSISILPSGTKHERVLGVLGVHFQRFLEKRGGLKVNNKWQDRLAKLLEDKNTTHNTAAALREAPIVPPSTEGERILEKHETHLTLTPKTPKTPSRANLKVVRGLENTQTTQNPTPKTPKTTRDKASTLGLIAMWSREFGYISLHDPTTGTWHDLRTGDAPDWAVREARKRRELRKAGNNKAYRLTSREMEEIRVAELVPGGDGIVEDYPVEEE